MPQTLTINFAVGAFPVGFKGNCQDFANALVDRLTGTIALGTSIFTAQYGGPRPTTDIGPWWQNGTDLYVFDYSVGSYQPMEDQTPIGACILWAGAGAPARYLLCQGQNVSRTQYSRLFQRIGTQWGAGDGANTFGLPPCGQYIVAAGADSLNNSGTTYNNGTTGGAGTFLLQPNQLPELYVLAYSKSGGGAQGGTGADDVESPEAGNISANWPVYSSDGLPVTQRNGPIPLNPQWMAMNLCIRYI
jgi:microcystin-dependent protein